MTLVTNRLNLHYLGSILVDMFVDCWKHRSEGHRKDLNLMFGDVILNLILSYVKLEASVGMSEIALGALLEAYRGNEALVKIDKVYQEDWKRERRESKEIC